uniref:thioredoxin-dependent peroxiredoxin n=1 Tax=Chaetoceros debilis TaxID=122233 RepID=A0A7S3QJY8_9STRA|mmetsp:Transcript_26003/g.38515  ORF Transcript_26003/g.38515 Transcript_26003/m.38515 type:complete len:192 (-) Transcript_26003:33-608(-)
MFSKAAIFYLFIAGASAFAPAPASVKVSQLNLSVGEAAPDFALKDQNGKTVKRSSIKKPLVVYFYPADATPGCTVQANNFNEQIKDIRKTYGADVVGISGQDVESKQEFARDLGLNFSILADEDDEVRAAFGVPKALFVLPGRVTYVLDKSGVCVSVYNNMADAASHVEKATDALSELPVASNPLASIFKL